MLKEGMVGRLVHILRVWSFGNSNGSAVFPLRLNPELIFLYVTAHPTGSLQYGSEALKKEKGNEKDADRNPSKEYSKVCVDHKKTINPLSKTAPEIFAAINADVKSGASS